LNIFGNNRPSPNDGSIANSHTIHYNGIYANPNIIAYNDFLGFSDRLNHFFINSMIFQSIWKTGIFRVKYRMC